MSRKRVGPFAVTRDMFANHSDLGVIAAFIGVGLFAVIGYAMVRGNGDSTAKVVVDRSTTSTPRFTAPPVTKPPVKAQPNTPEVTSTTPSTSPGAETTTTTRRKATRSNKGAGRGTPGAKSQRQKVYGPATNVRWTASPANVTLGAGAHISGAVVAKNLSSVAGWVLSPGCSTGPTPFSAAAPFALTCAPSGRQVVLLGSRSHRWEWAWNATVDGKINSAPLAPGLYSFKIGPATVTVTVI